MLERLRYLRFLTWCGPIFLAVFIVFWGILGHNIPPIAADLAAKDLGDFFRADANAVRLGMGMAMTFAVFYLLWGLAVGKIIEVGIEGENNILSTLSVWGAGLTVVPLMCSCVFWLAGAYRPEALDDSILQLLYDMGWLMIDMCYMVTTVQMIAMGVAFIQDQRREPLIPKWLAWYGIWVGFSFVAELLMPFFKSGIFARSGTLNFWIEFTVWFFWIVGLTTYMFSAIKRLEAEARGEPEHVRDAAGQGVGKVAGAAA